MNTQIFSHLSPLSACVAGIKRAQPFFASKPGWSFTEPLANASDATLMGRVGDGDGDAFAELVMRHEQWARTLSGRILGDFDEAEDITQEVFLKLWVGARSWQSKATLRAWLATLLTRQCLDHLRRKRPTSLEEDAEPLDLSPSVRERLEQESTSKRVAHLICQLPPRQRTALTLFYEEELSVRQGAEAMELSEKAFESLLQRARTQLKLAWRQHP